MNKKQYTIIYKANYRNQFSVPENMLGVYEIWGETGIDALELFRNVALDLAGEPVAVVDGPSYRVMLIRRGK